jgi:excisionase family DNA binding protein
METVEVSHRWFDLPGASLYASLPVKTLRAAISRGELPFSRPGKKMLVDKKDVDAWLMSLKVRLN